MFVSWFPLMTVSCHFHILSLVSATAVSKSSSLHLSQIKFALYLLGTSTRYFNSIVESVSTGGASFRQMHCPGRGGSPYHAHSPDMYDTGKSGTKYW